MKRKKAACKNNKEIKTAVVNEYCYFLDRFNKVKWGKIDKIFLEEDELVFQVICEPDYRYNIVEAKFCSFEEKLLKGSKRVLR